MWLYVLYIPAKIWLLGARGRQQLASVLIATALDVFQWNSKNTNKKNKQINTAKTNTAANKYNKSFMSLAQILIEASHCE